ncbi:HAD family hydrolase [bacterium]|nr:HAD family hydrolase [bacterium]
MVELVVFDFDGTLVRNSEFYRKVYSATLAQVVENERGKQGLEVLQYYREKYDGKGELSLFALNIPYRKWAQLLIEAPLDLVQANSKLVKQMRRLDVYKVIYTGSPTEMIRCVLLRLGFILEDFDDIIGWKEPELFPVKWTCSPLIFEMILKKFSVSPSKAWAVGDDWETDLRPAQVIGMNTAAVWNFKGRPTLYFEKLEDFLNYLEVKK